MKTFRFKILCSFLVLLAIFLSIMVPTVRKSVEHLVVESMSDRADELICLLSDAPDEKGLVRMVKEQGYLVFFHVALLNSQAELLYDSHIKRITGAEVIHSTATPIEVADALDRGFGKTESFCPLVGAKLSYIAKRFEFQENCYVLRLAFPYEYIHELKQKFTLGVIVFTSLLLGLFAIVTSIVIVHLMGPVRQMIKAIRPYHEGDHRTRHASGADGKARKICEAVPGAVKLTVY